jgi:activator of HSP90 ATPase
MSNEVGGEFEVFDGYCHGHNIDLHEGRKIIQAWFFDEEGWPEEHYSICKFEFTGNAEETTLTFIQTDVPVHLADKIAAGWDEFYWGPMQEYLESLKEE